MGMHACFPQQPVPSSPGQYFPRFSLPLKRRFSPPKSIPASPWCYEARSVVISHRGVDQAPVQEFNPQPVNPWPSASRSLPVPKGDQLVGETLPTDISVQKVPVDFHISSISIIPFMQKPKPARERGRRAKRNSANERNATKCWSGRGVEGMVTAKRRKHSPCNMIAITSPISRGEVWKS